MPHASVKLRPGVDQNETPALNEAGISTSNLIRFIYDQKLGALIQKLGGWTKFYQNTTTAIVRVLWAWQDNQAISHLGYGTENFSTTSQSTSSVAIGTGSKTFTIGTGLLLTENQEVTVSNSSTNYMSGTITSYNASTGSLVVNVTTAVGSGTYTSWTIYVPRAQLGVITNNNAIDITPRRKTVNVAASLTTTSGSNIVTISDTTTTSISNYDSVYIPTQISVGGLIVFGLYECTFVSSTSFSIAITDVLGNPVPATSSVSASGSLALFSVTNAISTVTVTLNNHGYTDADTFPVLVPTTVGGTTFYGNYPIQSITDANNFVITATTLPNATTTGNMNSNNARYIYTFGVGPIPAGTGYGVGGYGRGGYGSGTATIPSTNGAPITSTDWSLDNWGEVLLASPVNEEGTRPQYQPIYFWDAVGGAPVAAAIPEAPPVNDGFFVAMPQRQIIAWGSTFTGVQDPLLIRWCDVNNYNDWSATLINQAGSYRLPKGSKIVGCIQGPQQGLVWTDLGVWSMQYIGPPYVYSFNEIGSGCGMIARKAAASLNGVTYWMGPSQFFSLTDAGVQPVACPIWDVIFQNLDQDNLQKIRVAVNSRFGEITWYYPTADSNEVNAYAKYNALLKIWDYGEIGRSAWVDQSVLGPPIGADPTSLYLYQHETSTNADGQPMNSSFETGYFALSEADVLTFVDQVWPDMKWGYYEGDQSADIDITFKVANYPTDTPTTYGPFHVAADTQFVTPRFRGRLVAINVSSSDIDSFWRLGNIRYRYQPDGKF